MKIARLILYCLFVPVVAVISVHAQAQDFQAAVNCDRYADDSENISFAIQQCNRAIDTAGLGRRNLVTAFDSRARAWSNAKQFARAVEDASSAIKLFPKEAQRYLTRGRYQLQNGNFEAALNDFNQALRLSPGNAEAYFARGNLFSSKGDLQASIADLDRAIEVQPINPDALNNRCWDRLRSGGDLKKALADCDAAIGLKPKDSAALHSRCAVKLALADYNGAAADCTAALEIRESVHAHVDRGAAREKLDQLDLAALDYESAAKLAPEGKYDEAALVRARERLAALGPRGEPQAASPAAPPDVSASAPVVAAAAIAGASTGAATGNFRRIALVIGNSQYRHVPALSNPGRDAAIIAEQFRRSGFQNVTQAMDLGRDALVEALRKFSTEADNVDWAVVYYAGHGVEVGGLNYVIPVDAKLASDRAVQFEAVPLEQAMAAVEGARKLRLVILDACRDNPFAQQMKRTVASRSIGRGMGSVEPDAGTLVVYSAKHGQIALDGDSANSPFVTALAKRMMTPNLDVRRMFDYVRDDVMEATQRRQQPFSYGSLPGSEDFFFVASK